MDLYEDPQISTEGLVKSHSVGWSTILLASAWRCAVAMCCGDGGQGDRPLQPDLAEDKGHPTLELKPPMLPKAWGHGKP